MRTELFIRVVRDLHTGQATLTPPAALAVVWRPLVRALLPVLAFAGPGAIIVAPHVRWIAPCLTLFAGLPGIGKRMRRRPLVPASLVGAVVGPERLARAVVGQRLPATVSFSKITWRA